MQTVSHPIKNIHPLFDEFDRLYAEMSQKAQKRQLVPLSYDKHFEPLVDIFKQHGWDGKITFSDRKCKLLQRVQKKRKEIVLCFSGGKDSTATALYYQDRGYKVHLYHLHGINKMYKDEHTSAKNVADLLDLPYIEEDISITGWVQPDWIEHPMKNMIIANRAIQWAIRHHVNPRIAFGNFSSSTLDNDPFEVCGGDCKEMWRIYEPIIGQIIDGFSIETPLKNMQSTLDILFENQYLLDDIQSCIIPYHYKQRLRKRHAEKYSYKLPPNRCGSCWKCAVEYIAYCDNGIWEYDHAWYNHCLQVLKQTIKREEGITVNDIHTIWQHYFFYDIAKSHVPPLTEK